MSWPLFDVGRKRAGKTGEDTGFLFFSCLRFGKVEDAVVMYDKKTGRSRGFGFITYDNPDVVRKVSALLTMWKICRCRSVVPRRG